MRDKTLGSGRKVLRQFTDRCLFARALEILSGGGSEGEARAIKLDELYCWERFPFANCRIVSNSNGLTGITDNLEFFNKTIFASCVSFFICASVTGGAIGRSGVISTADQSPSVAVGSLKASLVTLAMPTIALPLTL